MQVIENVPSAIASREVGEVSAALGFSRDGWEVQAWGRNLTGDDYLISAFPSVAQFGSFSGYPSQPRTWGVNIKKKF